MYHKGQSLMQVQCATVAVVHYHNDMIVSTRNMLWNNVYCATERVTPKFKIGF